MRKFKQTLVMLLAAVMLLATVTTAMAATAMTDKGSVKITNAVAGVTYKLYRIFDISGISGDHKAAFITNEKWNDAVRTFNLNFGEFVGTGVGSAVTIKDFNSDANAQLLATKVVEAAKNGPIDYDATTTIDASGEATITGLQYGFYVMVSSRQGDTAAVKYTTFTIKSDAAVEVTEKNTKAPTLDKTVNGEHAISADFNAVLDYVITVTAAAGTDTYTITDTLPAQITLDSATIAVKQGDRVLTSGTDYSLTVNNNGFSIKLSDEVRKSLKDGDTIVVSYQGTLKANENTLTAYKNNAILSFTNENGQPDTREDIANVFSGHIGFVKKDNHDKILAGAKFVVKNKDGKYAELTGSGQSWSFVKWVDTVDGATVITTENSSATILVRGFQAGTYTLVETQAPDGYVKGADTDVKINAIRDENQGMLLTSLFTAEATVINTQGSELPSTGGIGTTIFYIAGALLAVSAVALLIVKRRKHA